jgi:hypothetical protein
MKSFELIYDKGNAMVIFTNPDFAATELCSTAAHFQSEIQRLRAELDAITADVQSKFTADNQAE